MTPELGQMAFGNPWGDYACPQWVDALVRETLREIERLYWNKYQRPWADTGYKDPGIPGLEYRPYYWGNDETMAAKPNLSYGNIQVRWYKHPMRSSSLNVEAIPELIIPWFEAVMCLVQTWGKQ